MSEEKQITDFEKERDEKDWNDLEAKSGLENYSRFEVYFANKTIGTIKNVYQFGHADGARWARSHFENEVFTARNLASLASSNFDAMHLRACELEERLVEMRAEIARQEKGRIVALQAMHEADDREVKLRDDLFKARKERNELAEENSRLRDQIDFQAKARIDFAGDLP
jgi:hypothetical protein